MFWRFVCTSVIFHCCLHVLPVAGSQPPLPTALVEDDACIMDGTSQGTRCSLHALQRQDAQILRSRLVHAPQRIHWERLRPAPREVHHELIFSIRDLNMDEVKRQAVDRSTPGSSKFRQWLSRKEVFELTANENGLSAARKALGAIGAVVLNEIGHSYIRASAPVKVWQEFLETELFVFGRKGHPDMQAVRGESYRLPSILTPYVTGVLKLLQLDESALKVSQEPTEDAAPSQISRAPGPAGAETQDQASHQDIQQQAIETKEPPPLETGPKPIKPHYASPDISRDLPVGDSSCPKWPCDTFAGMSEVLHGEVITPSKLRQRYNMPNVASAGSQEAKERAKTTQLVFSSLGQFWSPADRKEFQDTFELPVQAVTEIDSGTHSSDDECVKDMNKCGESNLDVQYMNAMSPWSHISMYYMDLNKEKQFDDFIVELLQLPNLPHVVSISYGMPEAGATKDSVEAFDNTMAKLALMGGTVLVSSGDDGAAGSPVRTYGCVFTQYYGLQASWPASSAYVTSVGATLGAESGNPEVVCTWNGTNATYDSVTQKALITSGGGFSKIEPRPVWQTGLPDGQTGRGVPDVSVAGHAYAVVIGGKWITVDGTSASSPAFAGMISMLNAERKSQGKSLLGFLNPALYTIPDAFFDITGGDNKCASAGSPCCGGYDAGPGWDAATGLGTPNFARLFDQLTKGP